MCQYLCSHAFPKSSNLIENKVACYKQIGFQNGHSSDHAIVYN